MTTTKMIREVILLQFCLSLEIIGISNISESVGGDVCYVLAFFVRTI